MAVTLILAIDADFTYIIKTGSGTFFFFFFFFQIVKLSLLLFVSAPFDDRISGAEALRSRHLQQ